MVDKKKKVKKQPNWVFSNPRKEALKKAQKVHVILINIGKKYRNKEIRNAKYKGLLK